MEPHANTPLLHTVLCSCNTPLLMGPAPSRSQPQNRPSLLTHHSPDVGLAQGSHTPAFWQHPDARLLFLRHTAGCPDPVSGHSPGIPHVNSCPPRCPTPHTLGLRYARVSPHEQLSEAAVPRVPPPQEHMSRAGVPGPSPQVPFLCNSAFLGYPHEVRVQGSSLRSHLVQRNDYRSWRFPSEEPVSCIGTYLPVWPRSHSVWNIPQKPGFPWACGPGSSWPLLPPHPNQNGPIPKRAQDLRGHKSWGGPGSFYFVFVCWATLDAQGLFLSLFRNRSWQV